MTNKEDNEPKSAKLKEKLTAKLLGHKSTPTSTRITNDNISEHREAILAQGKKLKYPVQYSKRRLIIVSVVVILIAIGAFSLWLNNGLYRQQQTGDFYYSVVKILPLNVADVDGQPVKYQDYLRRVRADIYYYLNKEGRSFNSDEGKNELDYYKRKELIVAEKAAYARGLAKELGVSVSDEEVDTKIKADREADDTSENDLISTLANWYGWTLADYKAEVRNQLLEQKVSYEIDTDAKKKIETAEQRLNNGDDFAEVAKDISDDELTSSNGGVTAVSTSVSDPTGVVDVVKGLAVGQTSLIKQAQINGVNCYYIVKLNSKTDSQLNYSIIVVSLTKFDDDFAKLQEDGKIHEYISVPAESEFNSGS